MLSKSKSEEGKTVKGLLLAGGRGTRLRPLTSTGNKHLIPIANKPMLLYGLEHLRNAGIKDIGIVVTSIKEGVPETVGDGSRFGVKVTYIEQPEPKGIAHAVGISKDFIGNNPFVVYLGDNLLKNGIQEFVDGFEQSDYDAIITLTKVKVPQRFGVAQMKGDKIVKLIEKPEKPLSNLALVGVYIFKPIIFKSIAKLKPSWRGELEITEAIQDLIDRKLKVKAHIIKGWWKDTGKPEDLIEANQLILSDLEPSNKGKIEKEVTMTGKVAIGPGTTIRKGCNIRGPTVIGKNCNIGPETYIGPYTSIGDNVTIKGGEIENTIVMNDATIKCYKRIVDSLIGKNSKIFSADKTLPRGYKLFIGDNASLSI